uniref:Insulin-like domain-containing protein n=1 Tax=Myripristis murdjan TaxID=586833 RepID=A0A667YUP5_9TELE
MRSLVLLVMLLCVLCVAEIHTEGNTQGLRLCGRAFLRAVVYTCGGSRWRRLMAEEETPPDSHLQRNRDVMPVAERRRRELTQALSAVCCQLGCQKNDISILC